MYLYGRKTLVYCAQKNNVRLCYRKVLHCCRVQSEFAFANCQRFTSKYTHSIYIYNDIHPKSVRFERFHFWIRCVAEPQIHSNLLHSFNVWSVHIFRVADHPYKINGMNLLFSLSGPKVIICAIVFLVWHCSNCSAKTNAPEYVCFVFVFDVHVYGYVCVDICMSLDFPWDWYL